MYCLYCNKRLGLFASRKRPFCSESHESAYHNEQAGLALRRIMDPIFTKSGQKAAPQAASRPSSLSAVVTTSPEAWREPGTETRPVSSPGTPDPQPSSLPPLIRIPEPRRPEPETATFRPIVVRSPFDSFLPQARSAPVRSGRAPIDAAFGFEACAGPLVFPASAGVLSGLPREQEDQEPEAVEGTQALGGEALDSGWAFSAPEEGKPAGTALHTGASSAAAQGGPDARGRGEKHPSRPRRRRRRKRNDRNDAGTHR